jgi:hypothetical protein
MLDLLGAKSRNDAEIVAVLFPIWKVLPSLKTGLLAIPSAGLVTANRVRK